MRRLFIDINVILDVTIARQPHLPASQKILSYIENKNAIGFISVISCTTIYYLVQKEAGHKQATIYLRNLLKLFSIVAVDKNTIETGFGLGAEDFEDSIQMACAQECKADYIITRNPRHYKDSPVTAISPVEYLATFNID